MSLHQVADIERLFNQTFLATENTCLKSGYEEPLYLPAAAPHPLADKHYHQILTSRDYYASCLHEIAHWCIAGAKRRRQIDYGYWYEADGRSVAEQERFARVEARPQALEWILAKSAGFRFRYSLDNISLDTADCQPFIDAIYRNVQLWLEQSIPPRAQLLCSALADFYQQSSTYLDADNYQYEELYT